MKKIVSTLVVIASLLMSNSSFTQVKKEAAGSNENSLLWEVSGNGLPKLSYLYGTIHMICGNDYFLSEKTKKAFNASESLFLEIDLSDPNELAFMQKAAMGTEPLSKKLTSKQLTDLDIILRENTGMTIQQVDSFSMLTVLSLISMKSFGCENLKFYEMEFIGLAKESKKSIGGLETIEAQIQFLNKAYSDDEMIAMLKETSGEETTKMVQNYVKENLPELYKEITTPKLMNENSKKWLLEARNTNWAVKMPNIMKSQSIFFAVGAAHLLGEEGLINLLRKAGYSVKPVLN
ncbi:MAG TPA: TraB/GumN family protein [Flavobacterium sp.]